MILLQKPVGEKKGIFDSIFPKLDFKLPWASNDKRRQGVESKVEIVPLGVRPGAGGSNDKVPVSRSKAKDGPQVYPSSFGGNSEPVVPLEDASQHFLGPRGLKFDKREAETEVLERSRRGLNDELGVASGYQVISEVDLAFKPSFEDGVGVTVFQGRILPEEIVYGVCLPATGFSVLFVLLSLLTVISVLVSGQLSKHISEHQFLTCYIVSGFVCYHRQLQKVAEEGAPAPAANGANGRSVERDWGITTLLRMPKA